MVLEIREKFKSTAAIQRYLIRPNPYGRMYWSGEFNDRTTANEQNERTDRTKKGQTCN